MATKRRKVLLRRDSDGMAHRPAWTVVSWPVSPKDPNEATPVITFTERLPGDVVRTKDEEVALESAIDRYTEAWETAYATHTDEARRAVTACGRNLRALLRGRR